MYRALPVSRQVASTSGRGALRRLTTDTTTPPKKKKNVFRRIILTTTTAIGTFYVGSTFIAFNNQAYYDIFADRVPLGQSMLEYAEVHKWDTITLNDVMEAGQSAVSTTRRFINDTISGAPTKQEVADTTREVVSKTAETTKVVTKAVATKAVEAMKTQVNPPVTQKQNERQQVEKKREATQAQKPVVSDDLKELVKKAEAALGKNPASSPPPPPQAQAPVKAVQAPSPSPPTIQPVDPNVYDVPLPVGFEPPPGYSSPAPPQKKPTESTPLQAELPLVAPAVSSLSGTEPVISHLAGVIDNLASHIASNPTAANKATDILQVAKTDLTALAERIDKVREEERSVLEAKLDEQTREYSLKLMELEMAAQDKLDIQEEEFRNFFEHERAKMIQAYREKLDKELQTQTELINERLKEEVIAQGIELQRRWIREIKVRVEEERGGRLAKLEELSANLKRLEQIALDNSHILDDNIRIHALWSAIRAVSSVALNSQARKPFRDELRVLRHIAAAREDELVSTVLESLEASDAPDVGVEPLADLTSWFTTSVSPKVSHVALVPDQDAGVLSYLASRALSTFRFKRQGLVEGDDILSVLARAEYYLNEKDLDTAARELNQLKGPAKMLLHDWLEAARRRLEVQQVLEVVQAQATIASLLVA
ncbi:hypothetical protein AMATHDRAFT_45771 [Amanita thiersii Skay4041]|uniref:MICOS complex subunit MIC60 n=1 Tax=Amanita thiersii Skay4041 TaxID=703135 RepID=A0A2A9NYU4_9AGAR|nr:hypothetical protein AMATHDRAFT_45771 [Amanita thiersii Skay4041]